MTVSNRIETLCTVAHPAQVAADIGCDHALTLIRLYQLGKIKKGIGSDVKEGPLKKARTNIAGQRLQAHIKLRLADGFEAIKPGEAQLLIVSGMGGLLIAQLLKMAEHTVRGAKQLIVQPQTECGAARKAVHQCGFRIEDERLLFEQGHYYIIISALPGTEQYDEEEYRLGRILPQKRSQLFTQYVEHLINKNNIIIDNLQAHSAVNTIKRIQELKSLNGSYLKVLHGAL